MKSEKRDPRERRANRLHLAWMDMRQAHEYLMARYELTQLAEGARGDHFHQALDAVLAAAIVAYARPFTENKTHGHADPVLGTKGMFKDRGDLKALHDWIIQRRHTVVAHGDWSERQTQLLNDGQTSGSLRQASVPAVGKGIDPDLFLALTEHVRRFVIERGVALDEELVRDAPDSFPEPGWWQRKK